ncbi:hypothetical protein FOMPIDRAFT_1017596 [Fomitopsis schrenkii]|uniref:Uncharacterized protein n=1 Tax=Fomitopsis schrenkii TaxID=2126942 RepID=S8E138_FOMSC|nr:hypothetical protein FOMPIDRAFT_1017596 [Fomitopsis schrenkii]
MPSQSTNGGNNNNNRDREPRNPNNHTGSSSHNRNNSRTDSDDHDGLRTFNWGLLTGSLRTSLATALRYLTTSGSAAVLQDEAAFALDRFTAGQVANARRAGALPRRGQAARGSQRTQVQSPPRAHATQEADAPRGSANPQPSSNPPRRPLQREYAFYGADDLERAQRWNRQGGPDPMWNPPEAAPWARPNLSGTITAARASSRRNAPANTGSAPQDSSSDAPGPAPASGASNAPTPGPSNRPSASGSSNRPSAPAPARAQPHQPAAAAAANAPYDFRANATRLLSSPEGIAALVAAADHRTIIRAFLNTEAGPRALIDVAGARGLAALLMEHEDGVRAIAAAAERHWHAADLQRQRMARVLRHVEPAPLRREASNWEGGAGEGEPAPEEPVQEQPVSINEFLDDVSMVDSEEDARSLLGDAAGSDVGSPSPAAEPSQPPALASAPKPDSPTRGTKRTREEEPQEEAEAVPSTEGRRVLRRRLSDGSAVTSLRPAPSRLEPSMPPPRARSEPAPAIGSAREAAINIEDLDEVSSKRRMRSPRAKSDHAPL